MKKIVFLGGGLVSGGAEHQCAQLMNMLIEKDYEVTYAAIGDAPDHYYVDPKVKRVWLGAGKSSKRKVMEVIKYMILLRADVVVAFSQRMSTLSLFPLLLRPDIKVISSERNFTIEAPDKFEKILTKTGIYRRANYIVPNNHSQGRYLAEIMPSIANKLRVITNYTEIDTYTPSPVPNNEVTRIGVFCRFERQKNFHRFIEMLEVLKNKNVPAFHVDWYGNHTFKTDSQSDYFETGLRMIQKYGVEDFITIHEPTREVAKLIPTFDAMCLPSLHEGFSNSISEYICCGRPVICSDVSDNSIMVHESENGFLFNPLDIDDMARAFSAYLKTSVEERCSMGLKSRKIAESLFDKEQFVRKYIELIES